METPKAPSSEALDLPKFSDRLPDLVQVLRQVGGDLQSTKTHQSYIPYWEDIYTTSHSLKGVLKILQCPDNLSHSILQLNDVLLKGLSGTKICRKTKEAGTLFQKLAELLNIENLEMFDRNKFSEWHAEFYDLHIDDLDHAMRLQEIPPHLFYINEFVSKKAREITLLQLNHCTVEDEILLDEIPLWRTQLTEALTYEEFGRGLIINFLPFLSPDGNRKLKVWAWVAAATHSRASLKQRIKDLIPTVHLGKI